ncbi:hypothetical protein V6N13_097844 [Hibiscus sabdariffa]|uniref:Uncharacterized protein n=2 Tax=Hibiscus sabdariffa TaxID=183260 RepID=A0ABR1ZL52_9ROSI
MKQIPVKLFPDKPRSTSTLTCREEHLEAVTRILRYLKPVCIMEFIDQLLRVANDSNSSPRVIHKLSDLPCVAVISAICTRIMFLALVLRDVEHCSHYYK